MEVTQVNSAFPPSPPAEQDTHCVYDDKRIPRTFELPLELPSTPVDPNEALVEELKGRVMRIPNMLNYMENWPVRELNQYYHRMQTLFNEALDRVIPDPRRRQKFKDCDFAHFCALWWPHGEWEDFYSASFFALWIFVWDDTIDANDQELSEDFQKACRFRSRTLDYCRYYLGLSKKGEREPEFPSLACGLFKEFAGRIVEKFQKHRVQRIYDEIVRYIRECENEQAERLAGRIPNLDEYIDNRMGTAAVLILCGINELFIEQALPDWMMDSPEMDVIWRETSLAIIIINDVLSLKKEMATGCLLSLAPVLYRQGIEWDDIVPELMEELMYVCRRFDEAAATLEAAGADDPRLLKDVRTYLDTCRTNSTGTYIYTIESKRYKIAPLVQEDLSVTIVL
ncbi:Terpenoid synthase [Coniochaeta hoffmannii]|uniref:Terpene synthase n=1 Tax=Coniochaeta hoffmannii TaxID=91930 RepID=A0AA38RXA6_9PEZI|nr:Terpenoid synthase [Coniochaeta hoffmannii]